MKRLILILLSSLFLGSEAFAEACTCANETFSASSETAAGGWDGCTPSADDTFTINSGCTVTLSGDWTLSGAGGITCASGGGLSITGGSTKLDIVMGSGGMNIQAGCTFNANGAYVSPGTSPSFVSEPSTETYFQFGDYGTPQTCAGTSCTVARISYPSTKYDSATTANYDVGLSESVDAIDAGDILSFWNPSGVSAWGSPDVNMAYPITASSSAGSPFTIDFDVYVAKNQPIPQAGQEIVGTPATAGTTASAALKGTTTVTVPAGTFSATTAEYAVGRWLRLESGTSATYEPFGYRILRVTDGGAGADTIEIADLRGFQYDYASGVDFVIDYGWRTGDPFLVYRPVRFACATDYGCTFTFSGTVDVSAVHFEQIRKILFSGNPNVTQWTDVFIQGADGGASASIAVEFDGATTLPTVNMVRTVLVGDDGSGDTGGQTVHGFGHGTSGNGPFTLNLTDSMTRFIGDDVFVTFGSGSSYINLTRFRAQWSAEAAASAPLADGAGGTSDIILSGTDVECVACTGDNTSSDAVFNDDTSGNSVFSVSGLMLYGIAGGIYAGSVNESLMSTRDVLILGGGNAGTASYWWALPTMTNFVIRGAALGTNQTIVNTGTAQDALNWRNGLIYRNTHTGSPSYAIQIINSSTPAVAVRNVAFIDNDNSGSTPQAFNLFEVKTGSVFENITIAQTPNFTSAGGMQRGFNVQDATDPTYTIRNILITGLTRASAFALGIINGPTSWTSLTDATRWCLFNNTNHITGITEAQFFASPGGLSQIGRPPGLLDPLRYRVGAWNGSLAADYGCGANTRAGITSYRWMHAISGLEPENVGTLGGGGGSGGWVPRGF